MEAAGEPVDDGLAEKPDSGPNKKSRRDPERNPAAVFNT